jgi:signal transduction histidine kinase
LTPASQLVTAASRLIEGGARFSHTILIDCDRELEQLARQTCDALCEETGVIGVAFVLTAGNAIQIVATRQPSGRELAAELLDGETAEVAFTAVQILGFAESADQTRAAAAAQAGPFTVLLVCECDEYPWLHQGSLSDALACSARIAGHAVGGRLRLQEAERQRRARQHTKLATTIHSDVIQRIFGASLVLDGAGDLKQEVRAVCARELERALTDLRSIIGSAPDDLGAGDGDLCLMLRDLATDGVSIDATPEALSLAPRQEEIVCSILGEAMRNARKHADPGRVRILARADSGVLGLSVSNDGVRGGQLGPASRPGVGLQLAAAEAALGGGVLEFGPEGPDRWALRLTLPQEERDESECCDSADGGAGR